ncbi:uncharacterized protein LOC116129447 [Pistacia vera]|uniref:uncharacterized protein LOC116129447 n=1 Tax=Pistacia vera TaxID=55513 RepID=UPI001263CF72|nr:uncharacterized protein LOC116129447 [Pistacia vera]
MVLPPGLHSSHSHKVCKLQKSLYELKQASRQWFSKLTSALLALGYVKSSSDYSLFIKHHDSSITVLLVYVDNITLAGNNLGEIDHVKRYLDAAFKIKDLSDLKFFLGLEVARTAAGIALCQHKYALDILSDAGFLDSKPAKSPMDCSSKLSQSHGDTLHDASSYHRLIGCLLYLTSTRPDIFFVVQQLSQYLNKPTSQHLQAAHRVLCYIKGCPAYGLFFPARSSLALQAFSDSDWARCIDTRHSVTGFCVFLGSSLINRKAKKQPTVSRSSSKVEYRALASTACELQWLRYLLQDLHVDHPQFALIFCDNKSALQIAANPTFHERTKHIEIDCHLVREKVHNGLLHLMPYSSTDQLVDVFTKPLAVAPFHAIISKLVS